jgi:hypothetical protein
MARRRLRFFRRGQIALKGGLSAGRFPLAIGGDRPIVFDAEIPGGGFAEELL